MTRAPQKFYMKATRNASNLIYLQSLSNTADLYYMKVSPKMNKKTEAALQKSS